MAIVYEWLVETVQPVEMGKEHEDDEILESFYYNNPKEALEHIKRYPSQQGEFYRIAVMRENTGSTRVVLDRQWAYVNDRQLPERFVYSDGFKGKDVPKELHRKFLCAVMQFKKLYGIHTWNAISNMCPGLKQKEVG